MKSEVPIVYVVDDDKRVREALTSLVSSMGLDVAAFESAHSFLAAKRPDSPSCLILDLRLGKVSGLDVQRQLAEGSTLPVIFISGHGDVPSSVRAMKAGAIEFLTKPFSDVELRQAIEAGIAKDRTARQERTEIEELRRRYETLSPREREVFPYVASGLLNKQTAGELGTAEITIRVHRRQIMSKMAAHSLSELVRMAEKLGLHLNV
jgi:FixJ family two-component response regulator